MEDNDTRGLKKMEIESYLTKPYRVTKTSEEEEPEKCSICFCDFQQGEPTKQLSCKHIYHAACISKWLTINCLCPLCKGDMRPKKKQGEKEEKEEKEKPGVEGDHDSLLDSDQNDDSFLQHSSEDEEGEDSFIDD